ncbi:Ankyrin-3 [Arthrobotrys entomopaga]|nr:Ankyrin-3 [Arthrobotrys entomopaga]
MEYPRFVRARSGITISREKHPPGPESLSNAVVERDENRVRRLLQSGVSPNVPDYGLPLYHAISQGDFSMTKLLLENGADVNGRVSNGDPLIKLAIQSPSDLELVGLLLLWGAKIDPMPDEWGPIHWAVSAGSPGLVRFLVEHGADLSARGKGGLTTLRLAIASKASARLEVIRYLLEEAKYPVNEKTGDGMSALYFAVTRDNDTSPSKVNARIIKLLLHHNADVEGEWSMPKMVLKSGYVDATMDRTRPLHIAVRNGHKEVVQMLLEAKADPNARAKDMRTPLHCIARQLSTLSTCVDIMKLLVDHGADVRLADDKGRTPLHKIITGYTFDIDIEMISILLERGADPNARSMAGDTPLSIAKKYNIPEIIELLCTPFIGLESLSFEETPSLEEGLSFGESPSYRADHNIYNGYNEEEMMILESVIASEKSRDVDSLESKKVEEWHKRRALKRKFEQERRSNLERNGDFNQSVWYGATQAVSTTNPAAEWLRDTQRLQCILSGDTDDENRVKIAIIDSGIYPLHPQLELVKEYKDFITQDDKLMVDETRHGSTGVDLITEIAPDADLYVARVFRGTEAEADTPELIAKAIHHAIDVWEVDIISLASGLHSAHQDIRQAVHAASAKHIIIFAAASNYGSIKGITFPARMYPECTLMCMFACSGMGKAKNEFNPEPKRASNNFALLGQDVPVYSHLKDKTKSGTSYATFVGAAVAALIIDFAMQSDVKAEPEDIRNLKTVSGMSAVFEIMAKGGRDSGYDCVVPTKLLGNSDIRARDKSRERIWYRISIALESVDRGW